MRLPVRHVARHVVWTVHGRAWAVWRLEAAEQTQVTRRAQQRRLAALEGLLKHLRGEAMVLSLCPTIEPVEVIGQMVDGVDLSASPRYVAWAQRLLEGLEDLELTGRREWLAVPLAEDWRSAARHALSAGRAQVEQTLGLWPTAITAAEEARRLEQAEQLAAGVPAGVRLRPATEGEILWMYGHAARRGVGDPLLPDPDSGGVRRRGRGRPLAAVSEAVLCEGGQPEAGEPGSPHDDAGGGVEARPRGGDGAGFGRRWLQVRTEHGASYQTMLALSEMPESFRFPGSEYLQSLDAYDFPVDWVMRLKISPGASAEAKTRRKAEELGGQHEEYAGTNSGPPSSLDRAAESLDEYRARLTSSATEVEVQASVLLCTWGATPQLADERAELLRGEFAGSEYQLSRPRGEQQALWEGMLLGSRAPRIAMEYAQYLTARDCAMSGPLSAAPLGDATGPLLGLQTSSGGARPVLCDWALAPRRQASASAAFVGELGAGKTVALKTAVFSVLSGGRRRGVSGSRGRAVITDRTRRREWAGFAEACPGRTQVIGIDEHAQVSLDPLRIFPDPREARRRTRSFLTLLLGLPPRSEPGAALGEAIDHVLAGEAPCMARLLEELRRRGARDAASRSVARQLADLHGSDLAQVVFDPALPVVATDQADSVVFATAGLTLPKREEMAAGIEHLEDEKVWGRGLMYLIAALSRQICFASPSEFAVAVWDETWWLTATAEGLDLLLEFVRDGRKHNAGAFVASHDAEDIGPSDSPKGPVVRGLFRRKFLFRHTDRALARRGLEFLGLDASDEDLLTLVTNGLSPLDMAPEEVEARAGECLHHDLAGRIGTMKILMPLDPDTSARMRSNPDDDLGGDPVDEAGGDPVDEAGGDSVDDVGESQVGIQLAKSSTSAVEQERGGSTPPRRAASGASTRRAGQR